MKKTLIACLIASTPFTAFADTLIGGDIEVNAWQQNQNRLTQHYLCPYTPRLT